MNLTTAWSLQNLSRVSPYAQPRSGELRVQSGTDLIPLPSPAVHHEDMEQTQANYQQSNNSNPPAPRRTLERRDAKLAGVAGGLGAYFDIDPTIIRVLLIVATLVSGPVVPLLYVAAWIIMPAAGYIHPVPPPPAPPGATVARPTATAPESWAPATTADVGSDNADDSADEAATEDGDGDDAVIDESSDEGSVVVVAADRS